MYIVRLSGLHELDLGIGIGDDLLREILDEYLFTGMGMGVLGLILRGAEIGRVFMELFLHKSMPLF